MARPTKAEMQDPTPIDVGVEPEAVGPAPTPSVQAEAIASQQSMLNIMRDKYKTEPRVRVKVHNDGPVQVQVNGYSFLITQDVWVEVPESVAEILDSAGYI